MSVFVFASDNITDIWAGIGAGLVAISAQTAQRPDVKTKASKMLGAYGVLYCSPWEALTTPFVVVGKPEDRLENEIWSGSWGLPFRIHSLGTPRKRFEKDEFLETLPLLQSSSASSWATTLRTSGTFSFVPAALGPEDWQMIVERLADKP